MSTLYCAYTACFGSIWDVTEQGMCRIEWLKRDHQEIFYGKMDWEMLHVRQQGLYHQDFYLDTNLQDSYW